MRILVTSDTYLPRLGGGEYHVAYLLKELRTMGHEVTLVTTEKGNDPADQNVIRVPYRGMLSFPKLFSVLRNEAKNADIIHSHYSFRLAWVAGIVARMQKKPFVITQHGMGLLPQVNATFLQRLAFSIWRSGSMKRADTIISTSEDMSVVVRELGFGSKIVPITNGYDPERFTPLPSAQFDPPVLLTVRRLVPKTGIQYLVAALPILKKKHPALRHICIGEGRAKEQIVELARTLGVSDMITFLGPVDHAHLIEYYAQASIVVLPSTAESSSLTCIEAMALGRIVVASRVGGLIELIGKNEERGFLVSLTESEHSSYDAPFTLPQERIRALADRISYALTHWEEATQKAQTAAAYAPSHFAWPILVGRTVKEVYEPLLRHS